MSLERRKITDKDDNLKNETENVKEKVSNQITLEAEHTHNKAIFDALNEAFDSFRTWGQRGPPKVWSKIGRFGTTTKYAHIIDIHNLDMLLTKVKQMVIGWFEFKTGTFMYN